MQMGKWCISHFSMNILFEDGCVSTAHCSRGEKV